MATIVNFENAFEMPLGLQTLEDFRRWSHSGTFPDEGRIDYVQGRIEVDMSPEDLFTHGTLKVEIVAVLHGQVRKRKLGHLFVDSTRVVSTAAELSAEPDIVFVSRQSVASGHVRFVPRASGEPDRYIELEGAPDLVVEIVSDSSQIKDTKRLPNAYFTAGVREFWLVDVRGKEIIFQINRRGASCYEEVTVDQDGFRRSEVFGGSFRLDRTRNEDEVWEYDLTIKDEPQNVEQGISKAELDKPA